MPDGCGVWAFFCGCGVAPLDVIRQIRCFKIMAAGLGVGLGLIGLVIVAVMAFLPNGIMGHREIEDLLHRKRKKGRKNDVSSYDSQA